MTVCHDGVVSSCNLIGYPLWAVMTVNKEKVPFLVDTGSQVTIVNQDLGVQLQSTPCQLRIALGAMMKIEGAIQTEIQG